MALAIVMVTGLPTSFDDWNVAGSYEVFVDDEVPAEHLANAALDVLHGDVAISNLDDFSFEVRDADGAILNQADEVQDYAYIDRGYVCANPDRNGPAGDPSLGGM